MSDPIVTFDEAAVRGELKELVRQTVEDTLNALLEEEADDLIGADRYERTADREAYRAGHYERGLTTTSGQVTLKMPKLKGMRFATAIMECQHLFRQFLDAQTCFPELNGGHVPERRVKSNGVVPMHVVVEL